VTVGIFESLSKLRAGIMPASLSVAYRKTRTVLACRMHRVEVPPQPHFDEASSAYFREQLATARNYLEYGSGGSTLLAARQAQIVVSVDSDAHFLAAVRRKLAAEMGNRISAEQGSGSRGARPKLIHVNIGFTEEWGMPAFTQPTRQRVRRWRNYPTAPWRYFRSIAQRPDLILIDGRFRVACTLESLLNSPPGSDLRILLDDYVSRPHYHVIERFADVQTVGRMAIVCPKRDLDLVAARQLFNEYCRDPR
jgi:hypothetical protein